MNQSINSKTPKIFRFCLLLSIFTTSFDIFLNIDVFGYNIRFTQLIILPVILLYCFNTIITKKIVVPVGGKWILLFAILQFIFMFRSPDLFNAIQYEYYLIFNILMVFSIAFFLNNYFSFEWLINIYIDSFFFVGGFGIVQFLLFPVGINLLVTQSWTFSLARINGFSYEPSFYSTYMLMGFVICAYLVEKEEKSISHLPIKFFIIAASLVLSSSRMGWLMIFCWIVYRIVVFIKASMVGVGKRKIIQFAFIMVLLLLFGGLLIYYIIKNPSKFSFLLSGLGIFGASAHSANDRINGLVTCINIFKSSPFLGYSLGGVDPIICKYKGISYLSGDNGSAMSIIGELLVSGGVVGTLIFAVYIFTLVFFESKKKRSELGNALVYALFFELMILCMNQNILRPYVWMHIAILCCYYKQSNRNEQEKKSIVCSVKK